MANRSYHSNQEPGKAIIIMNPFRTRKKPLDGLENQTSSVPTYSRTFKRGKKLVPEPKQPTVDIATALPSSDDFRTSLLMPNLSARFSMLREQDDPTSKIGKANDDSVLFPKRASRLNLFNRNGLTDIAEVASLHGSVRPAFASKVDSYASSDGYGTDDGYLMNRPRPTEGNNLFGGRQKIYRIPLGTRNSSGDATGHENGGMTAMKGMGGRALYGDDVASSAFSKLAHPDPERRDGSSESPSGRSSQVPDSPPMTYNQNRETTSSTTSVPVDPRISTAATSVVSQRSGSGATGTTVGSSPSAPASAVAAASAAPVDRPATKSRRLYGQGLDQHIHDQQSSAMHRLESLQRQRAGGASSWPRNRSQPRSGSNLHDRYQRAGAAHMGGPARAASPPPSGSPSRLKEFNLGWTEKDPSTASSPSEAGYFRPPPLSPPMSPVPDPTLVAALEPNDVGKATALGAFNKPRQQYDEQQYLERQMQLQERRRTPPMPPPWAPRTRSIDPPTTDRPRRDSPVSPLSRSNSMETGPANDPRRIVSEIDHGDPPARGSSDQTQSDHAESFLAAATPSDLGSPRGEFGLGNQFSPPASSTHHPPPRWTFEHPLPEKPRDIDHPIHRLPPPVDRPNSPPERAIPLSRETPTRQTSETISVDQGRLKEPDTDSPTLGPANRVVGLNDVVHTHLRNESGQSSVYPEPSPPLESRFPDDLRREYFPPHQDPEVRSSETFFRQSTWEGVGLPTTQATAGDGRPVPVAVPPPLSLRARHVLEHHHSPQVQPLLGPESRDRTVGRIVGPPGMPGAGPAPTWQDQLKAHHTRGGSTETEKERESFAHELAERRRMVQDNLKSFVESESRSTSPIPGNRSSEHSPPKTGTSFGMLRSKTSKGSMAGRPEHSSKAMKMLGIGAGPGMSNASLPSRPEHLAEYDEQQTANRSSPDLRIPAQPRLNPPDSRQHHVPIHSLRRAEQSDHEFSDRGLDGRHGRLATLDTQARAAAPGYHPSGAQARMYNNFSRPPADPGHSAAPPSVLSRFRSNSRANGPGYVEQRGHLAGHPTPMDTSPSSTRSGYSTPSHEPSPNAPVMTTPFMIAPSQSTGTMRVPAHRKRSINKQDISDPTFISSTSSISTIDLPPGASLSNGMDPEFPGPSLVLPPPIPPINPRRRRTQTLRQALGRLEKPDATSRPLVVSQPDLHEERSTFSADESEGKARYRTRLRKTSSEGGNMHMKARQQLMLMPSPAMPPYPQSYSAETSPALRNLPHPVPVSGPVTGAMF